MPREGRQGRVMVAPTQQLTRRAYQPNWSNMHEGLSVFSSLCVQLRVFCMWFAYIQWIISFFHSLIWMESFCQIDRGFACSRSDCLCLFSKCGKYQLENEKQELIKVLSVGCSFFFFDRSTGTRVPSSGPCRDRWTATGHYLQVPSPCAPQALQRPGGCAKESKKGVAYLCVQRDYSRHCALWLCLI